MTRQIADIAEEMLRAEAESWESSSVAEEF